MLGAPVLGLAMFGGESEKFCHFEKAFVRCVAACLRTHKVIQPLTDAAATTVWTTVVVSQRHFCVGMVYCFCIACVVTV